MFRANIVAYFTIGNIVALAVFSATGLIKPGTLRDAGIMLPGMVVGVLLGSAIAPRVPEGAFRVITLVIVATGGIIAALTGLGVL